MTTADADKAVTLGTVVKMFEYYRDNVGAVRPVYNETTGRYTNDSIEAWLDSMADGLVYGVKIERFQEGLPAADEGKPFAEKTDANVGLVLEPSSNTVAGRNDYTGKKLFNCTRVNGGVDANGMPYVTAIEGLDDRFNCETANTWALTPVYYNKYSEITDDSGTVTHDLNQYTDTPREGFTACAGAYLPDGTTKRPYILRACYMDSDGNCTSKSGTKPTAGLRGITSNNAQGYWHYFSNDFYSVKDRSDGLTYLSYGDVTYQFEFLQLMLGVKAPAQIIRKPEMQSLKSAKVSIGSTGKSVKLNSSNCSWLAVGDYVCVGTAQSLSNTAAYSVVKSALVTDIQQSGSTSTVTLNLDSDITTTTSNYLCCFKWDLNGVCDNVLGTYGSVENSSSIIQNCNTFKFQNIEWSLYFQELVNNVCLCNGSAYIAPDVVVANFSGDAPDDKWTEIDLAIPKWGTIADYKTVHGARIPSKLVSTVDAAHTISDYYASCNIDLTGLRQLAITTGIGFGYPDEGLGSVYAKKVPLDGNWYQVSRASSIGRSALAD